MRLCVEADPNPNVTVVSPVLCDGSAEQRWDIQPTAGGQRIRNAATGQVMVGNVNQVLTFGLVFEQPPVSSTPGKVQQAWKIGS